MYARRQRRNDCRASGFRSRRLGDGGSDPFGLLHSLVLGSPVQQWPFPLDGALIQNGKHGIESPLETIFGGECEASYLVVWRFMRRDEETTRQTCRTQGIAEIAQRPVSEEAEFDAGEAVSLNFAQPLAEALDPELLAWAQLLVGHRSGGGVVGH
ncbi:hypothetical protein, partial [Sinorhizobium meliloti]|uniref:hypothetical protein n=1 Tax=Rhizobium meliloti TaxID=382 RepID=UPI001F3C1CDC